MQGKAEKWEISLKSLKDGNEKYLRAYKSDGIFRPKQGYILSETVNRLVR